VCIEPLPARYSLDSSLSRQPMPCSVLGQKGESKLTQIINTHRSVLERMHQAINTDPTTVVPRVLRKPSRLRGLAVGSRIDRRAHEGIRTMPSSCPSYESYEWKIRVFTPLAHNSSQSCVTRVRIRIAICNREDRNRLRVGARGPGPGASTALD